MYKSIMYKYYMGSIVLSLLFIVSFKDFNVVSVAMYSYILMATIVVSLLNIKRYGDDFVKENYPNLYAEYKKESADGKCHMLWASDSEKRMYSLPIGLSLAFDRFNVISKVDEDIAEAFNKDLSVILLKKDGFLWIIYSVFVLVLMIFLPIILTI